MVDMQSKYLFDEVHLMNLNIFDFRVKCALDLKTNRQVAVKLLRVSEGKPSSFCKPVALECFFREIQILSECDHQNIVKVKTASLDGVVVTERVPKQQSTLDQIKNLIQIKGENGYESWSDSMSNSDHSNQDVQEL